MPTLRTFSKSEEAYACAAYLGSCGIDASVYEDNAYGGNLLGSVSPGATRIDVPEEQLEVALRYLNIHGESPARAAEPLVPGAGQDIVSERASSVLFRALICYDSVILLTLLFGGDWLNPPAEVESYLRSMALSDGLWNFAYLTYRPLIIFSLLSNFFAFWFVRIGKVMVSVSVSWWVLITLGPPPQFVGPWSGFIAMTQTLGCGVVLALMYLSPLKTRFR